MTYATIAALRADCEELLRKFQFTDSVRYSDFCDVWKEMKFGDILKHPMKELYRLQFMEECYLMALSFCHSMHPFQYRTGGLYLLYGFYFKQMGEHKVNIRITQQQWQDLESFINEAEEQGHHDINFIYHKLLMHHAFHFVAHPRELAPFYYDIGTTEKDNFYTLQSTAKEFCEEGYIDQLRACHHSYIAQKNKAGLKDVGSVQEDFISSLANLMRDFDNKCVEKLVSSAMNKIDDEDMETIGAKRTSLKKYIMKKSSIAIQSRRHRNVELEQSTSLHRKKKGRPKRSALNALMENDAPSTSGDKMETEENSSQSMPILTIDESA